MKPRSRVPAVLVTLVGLPTLLVGGFLAYLQISGTPLIDEWSCGDGEAPVLMAEGGSYCERLGATLPDSDRWDPFGNRPAECHDRWGFTEVQPRAGAAGQTVCVAEGDPVPEGWAPVPGSD